MTTNRLSPITSAGGSGSTCSSKKPSTLPTSTPTIWFRHPVHDSRIVRPIAQYAPMSASTGLISENRLHTRSVSVAAITVFKTR